ncbi:PREDICTED: F-box/LRR-repeat protein 4-like isoform X1 [Acromyrmex echinatior]|uniref:F-box/LRR-repeat protein 4-like isoform X1 n=2 Tax=Acromyrmex echinatior TaxID=103372 RepID=UPI0005810509|nr:PREDICTED: F-box/LRR-repeat protein 4-like isoform X1 [Acromyrmex echinatior]XP_011056372.1 PREDICTED: F-box/LRR-repeat protein 4-like isoform X1 [Acromyrmex echinatior]
MEHLFIYFFKNMLSLPQLPLYSDNDSQHVERVPIGKENHVDFVQQFVKNVRSFSSQYGGNSSISYAATNIIGPFSQFPNYGDFAQTFAMRTYGPWWDKAPSRSIDYMPQNNTDVVSQDYIDIEYHEAVYPVRVSIYEVYNPGSVIRIWAEDFKGRWFLLWNGPPQIVPPKSRIFSPPLQSCDFKTKLLRLEFNHSLLDYYTDIDAVMLIGTSELIFPKDPAHNQSLTNLLISINCDLFATPCREDIHNLTPNYKNAHLDIIHLKKTLIEHCIMCKSDVVANFHDSNLVSRLGSLYYYVPPLKEGSNSMQRFLSEELSKFMKDVKHSSDESKKPSRYNFSALPVKYTKKSLSHILIFSVISFIKISYFILQDEIIMKILRNLDLKSLCRMSRVNKHFNNLAQDHLLYTSLNLKPYWNVINTKALYYLAPRCKYLRRLDLSWCNKFSVSELENFLVTCGSLLTHLRLNCCSCVDNNTMLKISRICKNLKELGLRNCELIKEKGFSYLENLEFLEHLDLYRTHINTQTLCKILRRNIRMRHLRIGCTDRSLNVDEVAMELRNSCPDLESIDLWKTHTLTSQGIDALADCKNLREVDFGWCGSTTGHGDSFRRLFSSCQHLEKVFLICVRGLTERDLRALTLCKNLKQLDLLGTLSVTTEICHAIFMNCTKLEMIDISFCNNIAECSIQQWQQIYTHIAIKSVYSE